MAGYEGFTKLGNGLWIDNRTQKIGTLKPTGRGGWYVEEITKQKFKRRDVQERQAREKYEKLEDEWSKAYQPYKNGWKVNPKEDKALMDLAKRHDEALENMKMYQSAYLGKKSEYGRPTQYKGDISNLEGKHIAGREARAREIDKINKISQEEYGKMPKDYKGTLKELVDTAKFRGENPDELRKMYEKMGYDVDKDKTILELGKDGGTRLSPVKVEEDNPIKNMANERIKEKSNTLNNDKIMLDYMKKKNIEEMQGMTQKDFENRINKNEKYLKTATNPQKEFHYAGEELYSDDPNRYGDLRSYNEKMNPTKADNQMENINLKYLPRTTNTYAIEQKIEFDDGDKWVEIDRYKSKLKAKVKADRYYATRVFYSDEYRVKPKRTTAEYEQLGNMKSKYTQAEVDKIKAKVARFKERKGATKDNTISKSVSQLKNMYKNATEDEKAKIRAELNSRGYYRKNGRWTTK